FRPVGRLTGPGRRAPAPRAPPFWAPVPAVDGVTGFASTCGEGVGAAAGNGPDSSGRSPEHAARAATSPVAAATTRTRLTAAPARRQPDRHRAGSRTWWRRWRAALGLC